MIFKFIALMEMAAFYGCYFLKMYNQRKNGIQTNHMGKDKVGFVKLIETALKILTILVPVVELVSIFFIAPMLSLGFQWCGAILGAIGVTVFILAVVSMKDSWRAGVSEKEKTTLVTEGIYQISRNPAFLGFDLMYIGILFMFFNWPLFVVSALAMLFFHLQIVNVEEDFLIATFGDEYLAYMRKVRRYYGVRK